MLRILFVSHLNPPEDAPLENMGGIQRVSEQLYNELSASPDVEVVPMIHRTTWDNIGVKVGHFLIRILAELPYRIRQHNIDIVLFTSMVSASTAYMLRRKINVPMVSINHGHDVTLNNVFYQKLVPKIFGKLDGLVSVSTATLRASLERGLNPLKGIVLPNGYDSSTAITEEGRGEGRLHLQEQLGLDLDNTIVLLTVGRQVRRKGHEWFIKEVFPKLKNNVIYIVIGDGPEHERLKKVVADSPHEKKIWLMGRQPDEILRHIYAASDIFIMPNIPVDGDMEGFGVVMLEANLAYTPAIASDIEGIKDVIEPGHNGYRIPHSEPEEFAKSIDRVIKEELPTLQVNSRKFVEEKFNWAMIASRYVEYLNGVVNQYNKARTNGTVKQVETLASVNR